MNQAAVSACNYGWDILVAAEWDTSEIGNVQVDFVLHCGRSTGGDYIHTISAGRAKRSAGAHSRQARRE